MTHFSKQWQTIGFKERRRRQRSNDRSVIIKVSLFYLVRLYSCDDFVSLVLL